MKIVIAIILLALTFQFAVLPSIIEAGDAQMAAAQAAFADTLPK